MLYMVRRTTLDGKVLFRKAGLMDSSSVWNKNGKCWTSKGAFKSFLGYVMNSSGRRTSGGAENVIHNYPEDTFEILEIDTTNGCINTSDFLDWCAENDML